MGRGCPAPSHSHWLPTKKIQHSAGGHAQSKTQGSMKTTAPVITKWLLPSARSEYFTCRMAFLIAQTCQLLLSLRLASSCQPPPCAVPGVPPARIHPRTHLPPPLPLRSPARRMRPWLSRCRSVGQPTAQWPSAFRCCDTTLARPSSPGWAPHASRLGHSPMAACPSMPRSGRHQT